MLIMENNKANTYAKFLDEYTDSVPSEGNLLSLLTMKQFYQGTDRDSVAKQGIIGRIAQEENQYLMKAMEILGADLNERGLDEKVKRRRQRMQDKFGKDFKSAVGLAALLKSEADELEFRKIIQPELQTIIAGRGGTRNDGIFVNDATLAAVAAAAGGGDP